LATIEELTVSSLPERISDRHIFAQPPGFPTPLTPLTFFELSQASFNFSVLRAHLAGNLILPHRTAGGEPLWRAGAGEDHAQ
jgi:hypothetical protein